MKEDLALLLASPDAFRSLRSRIAIVMSLTWPAVLAQMSNIVMEYIDAAMVGSLGSLQAASIGLVATSTWLIWGLGAAACTGFAVQVAHRIGAGDDDGARGVFRRSLLVLFLFGLLLAVVGLAVSIRLPYWLGGTESIATMSTHYFAIFSAGMPLMCLTFLCVSTLRSSGNMLVPGLVNVVLCFLDVAFNFFLIFPTRTAQIFGTTITIPGAGLGVAGAATGTVLAYSVGGIYCFYYLVWRSPRLCHPFRGKRVAHGLRFGREVLRRAVTISWPVALERVVMCGAQILVTTIVAPLGNAAIAANAFAVTAESLCYAPGYGVSDAATTLVGQSLGAGRKDMALSFARISVISGMVVMGILGCVMWILAPEMMMIFSSDETILSLGTTALRTEAWAEPMFGAAIVIYGVFVGAGYTVVPACLNFSSIWVVRITLCAILAPTLGLYGVWLAMCIEICFRGTLFLIALFRRKWLHAKRLTADSTQQTMPASAPVPEDEGDGPVVL